MNAEDKLSNMKKRAETTRRASLPAAWHACAQNSSPQAHPARRPTWWRGPAAASACCKLHRGFRRWVVYSGGAQGTYYPPLCGSTMHVRAHGFFMTPEHQQHVVTHHFVV